MVVYPEIESWNEFYPSEIFIRMAEADTNEDMVRVFKLAKIGTTIYLGKGSQNDTIIYKKIGDIEDELGLSSNTIFIGHVKY